MSYTWSNGCYGLESPCAVKAAQQQAASCAETQTWFWLLAAGLALLSLGGGK
jgi:hypothetical protein